MTNINSMFNKECLSYSVSALWLVELVFMSAGRWDCTKREKITKVI